jgi:outer membrane protein assembly factor BamB
LAQSNDHPSPFVAQLNPQNGEVQWSHTVGSLNANSANTLTVDSAGDVVVVGQQHDGNQADLFVAKLNPNGQVKWEETFGSSEDEVG